MFASFAGAVRPAHNPLIHSAIISIVAAAVCTLGEMRPCAITTSGSQISNSSSSSSLTTRTAQPLSRSREQLAADLRGGADVDAPGRLRDDQQLGVGVDLAADQEFLQISLRTGSSPPRRGRRP